MMAEAMCYAVEKVNNQTGYLHGYKIKVNNILDASNDKSVLKQVLNSFLDMVGFLIGPYSSETSYQTSILTDTFSLLSLSYSATYGDFGRFGTAQNYMFRTVPSDEFRILAILNFMQQTHWNYVGVISSHGYDGERDAVDFISKLSHYDICLPNHKVLQKFNDETYRNTLLQ